MFLVVVVMFLKNAGSLLKKFFAPAIENIIIDFVSATEFSRGFLTG
jgi:hypothetical protein